MSQATHRQPLDKILRRALEATVIKARDIAELAATQALTRLSVGEARPADYLNEEQRELRNRLRAHGRQLGDIKQDNGQQSITRLVTEAAYQHWHRMLFARFLEQNNLLMYDEHTPLSLAECSELVQDPDTLRDEQERRCQSGWELAGVLASKMLPQIFRVDSPVFALEFAPEHQRQLEKLVIGIAPDTFQAQDSLGWVYQFWQSKRKKEVNDSEVKIGADELSPVTQLFTEPYMVSFLLDNSLGAWWAGERLSEADWQTAQSEQELRDKAAIPGVPLTYLRFVKTPSPLAVEGGGEGAEAQQWQPASGTFDAWPKHLSELKVLDPCCGSGHFLVAAFLMLVPMRMQAEQLNARQAIDRVLSENLHGLELDQRCVELAAFAVALEAWRYPDAGGYRPLPELHLACAGLSISTKREKWLALAGDDTNLRVVLDEIYAEFSDASVLGSLINPGASLRKGSLFELEWEKVRPLLSKSVSTHGDYESHELGVVAQGLAKTASQLSNKYQLVITNVPYLGRGDQSDTLKFYSEKKYAEGMADLATTFILRILDLMDFDGQMAVVSPQAWLLQAKYKDFRNEIMSSTEWAFMSRLGPGAFETISGQVVNVLLAIIKKTNLDKGYKCPFIDALDEKSPKDKALFLSSGKINYFNQSRQANNPEQKVTFEEPSLLPELERFAYSTEGLSSGDGERFIRCFWEVSLTDKIWSLFQEAPLNSGFFTGRSSVVQWCSGDGEMTRSDAARIRGHSSWGKKGIAISKMSGVRVALYGGGLFSKSCAVLTPREFEYFSPVLAFVAAKDFEAAIKVQSKNLAKATSAFEQVPFDLDRWAKVADEQYPNGLPQPYINDPTQWVFHGHPCGSVIWDDDTKWTAHGELRVDESVLQVAVARLLGYKWPAELDPDMELAAEQREWVERCQELVGFVDDDGIVCLPPVRGEKAADQRLEAMLQAAYGDAWTTPLKNRLLKSVGSKSLSLWLRDKFFEQHCKMFQHRPFIWHIWDGLKDGFSALVNYHKLDKAGLERLIYTYLGDWIRTQQAGLANSEDGAQERLAAAEALKKELEAILKGKKPYDIFVRWKPLAEQSIGWNPDLNDGVRLNIRPFLKARDVARKDAGILRWKPNIHWRKDRGKDVESAPWYELGLQYGEGVGTRINDHHLTLEEKRRGREEGGVLVSMACQMYKV